MALVAQEPVLYEGSARYNILYGCDWANEEDMLNAAQMANVHNFIMEAEHQYDTNCGEKGVQLSGESFFKKTFSLTECVDTTISSSTLLQCQTFCWFLEHWNTAPVRAVKSDV